MPAGPSDDYYELFGVAPDADLATLRRAWRRLVLKWHPDRGGPDTTTIFQQLAAVYAVLSDPIARAAYDRQHRISVRVKTRADAERRRAPGVLLTRISRPLEILLMTGTARRAADGVIELFLDSQEIMQGGMITIAMQVMVRCPACHARGATCVPCSSRGAIEDRFSAWLAVPPEVADGTLLAPSVLLPGMVEPVAFRVRRA
ncbi:MAG: DnaJ domain-containing protein [Kofleriaceae bacterium]